MTIIHLLPKLTPPLKVRPMHHLISYQVNEQMSKPTLKLIFTYHSNVTLYSTCTVMECIISVHACSSTCMFSKSHVTQWAWSCQPHFSPVWILHVTKIFYWKYLQSKHAYLAWCMTSRAEYLYMLGIHVWLNHMLHCPTTHAGAIWSPMVARRLKWKA